MNLTALSTPAQVVQQGFLDSLVCAPLLPAASGLAVDVGSGAGFPAIPLALVKPAVEFTLVEPSRKRVTFLRHVIRRLKLTTVRVRPERVEALLGESDMLEAFDVALARAVAPLPEVGQMVWPLLRPAGIFLAQIGSGAHIDHEVERLTHSGFATINQVTVPPEFGISGRRVLALRKSIPR